MFNKIRDELDLLISSSKLVGLFEITYKLVAIAIIYPLLYWGVKFGLKLAGVRYLTNEYILKVLVDPIFLTFVALMVVAFVMYCSYEMGYLAVCFETKRMGIEASVPDILFNTTKIFSRSIRKGRFSLFFFSLISIIFTNITVLGNLFLNETNRDLFKRMILRNNWYIKSGFIFSILAIYAVVVLGIYCVNISLLENKTFVQSFKKSASMVVKHPIGTIGTLVLYNLLIYFVVVVVYIVITLIVIVGVKLLDMAYIGNALFLSILKIARVVINIFLLCMAIPLSFSAISHIYYKYTDVYDINLEYIDYDEEPIRKRKKYINMILIAAVVANSIYLFGIMKDNPFGNIAIFHETEISAHRGASNEAPENTMAAFKLAVDNLADSIELDVRMTADDELVVIHDATALRTCGVNKRISEMSYREVSRLDAGSYVSSDFAGERVPRFKEVLKFAKDNIKLNIELKPENNQKKMAEKVVSLIENYEMESDCVITSFDYDILMEIKKINPDIQVGYIINVAYGDFYDDDNVDFFSMNAAFASKRIIDAIHNSGKKVYVWTVNQENSIRNLTNKGVDCIITDEPVLARETVYSRDTSEPLLNMIRYVLNK